jgi:hypothetical protein
MPFRVHADESCDRRTHIGLEAMRCMMCDKVIWVTDGSEFADGAR